MMIFSIILALTRTEEFFVHFFLICIVLLFILVPIVNIAIKKAEKKQEIKKISDALDERFMQEYEAINASEKSIVKAISKNGDDQDLLFFLNALLKNFRILEHKLLLLQRIEYSGYQSFDLEVIHAHDKNVIDELYKSPAPVYTDFASLIDSITLNYYKELSDIYTTFKLKYRKPIDNEYDIDWGNGYFYYVKVGNNQIPYFESENKEQVFIYPTAIIVYKNNIEFDFLPLGNVTIELKLVENAYPKYALISIKEANLEFTSTYIENAKIFYEKFIELQKYFNEEKLIKRLEEKKDNLEGLNRILKEVNKLVGLRQIKEDFISIANYIRIQQIRRLKGLKGQTVSYHCVFTGNPGTGKTTVARLLANVYKELGVVKSGHLVEVDRSKLIGEYVGQTAVKTNKVIDEALDGILFIDEAYSLVQNNNDDFGNEAISTLLKRMEDDRDRLVVVLAGYNEEMNKFINSNPGLQSRFTRYLHFDDYSASELREIFDNLLKANDYILTVEAGNHLDRTLREACANKTKNFGNARFVRNLFEKVCERQATRLSGETSLNEVQLRTLEAIDIPE